MTINMKGKYSTRAPTIGEGWVCTSAERWQKATQGLTSSHPFSSGAPGERRKMRQLPNNQDICGQFHPREKINPSWQSARPHRSHETREWLFDNNYSLSKLQVLRGCREQHRQRRSLEPHEGLSNRRNNRFSDCETRNCHQSPDKAPTHTCTERCTDFSTKRMKACI